MSEFSIQKTSYIFNNLRRQCNKSENLLEKKAYAINIAFEHKTLFLSSFFLPFFLILLLTPHQTTQQYLRTDNQMSFETRKEMIIKHNSVQNRKHSTQPWAD